MDGVIQNTVDTLLETTANEARKEFFNLIFEAVGKIVKQDVNRKAAGKVFSTRLNMLAKSHEIA